MLNLKLPLQLNLGLVIGLVCVQSLRADYPPSPALPTLSKDVVIQLMQDLQHEDFQIRETATADLIHCGFDNLEIVISLLENNEEEVRTRGIRCLQQMMINALRLGMDQDVDKLDSLINSVSESKYPHVRDFAREINQNYSNNSWLEYDLYDLENIWENYAFRRIQRDGGRIVASMSSFGRSPYDPNVEFGGHDIILGKEWHGSEHTLRMISRISSLKKVYLLKGHPFTRDQIVDLEASLPMDCLAERSKAKLGVMGGSGAFGGRACEISDVTPGSAADRAGIQVKDVIIGYEGQPISQFEDLIESIKQHDPGDKVKIKILRNRATFDLDVELDGWEESPLEKREREKLERTQQQNIR